MAELVSPSSDDFGAIRDWVDRLLCTRRSVFSHLLALEPFASFDKARATDVLVLADAVITAAADAVEGCSPFASPTQPLRDAANWWTTRECSPDGTQALAVAFAMSEAPVDEEGEFRADWVLQHYAYKTPDLLAHLLPHLASLGVLQVTDVLAAVSVVGWVLNCQDSATAYIGLDMFINRYLAADPAVAARIRSHLEASEPALRRTRQATNRALVAATAEAADLETRATALVDAYKRLVEGPFRQLSWALYCLRQGQWEPAPMLTNLRERLISSGGTLGSIAGNVVIPDLRNSETHETLSWDGFTEEFVTEDGRVQPSHVALAITLGDSFIQGCEAGLAAVRAFGLEADPVDHPLPTEEGRMPSWRRVQAFFGTNRLRLTEARLNTRHATVRVQRLAFTDINPCFQALVLAHRLLPDIETFSVSTSAGDAPLITVSAGALDAVMPVWEFAVSALDRMPLSTFLPANLDARRRLEPLPLAVRSAAWIAVDDALGVIDGAPEVWDESTRLLIGTRLEVVMKAIEQTQLLLDDSGIRLASVKDSVGELRRWITDDVDSDPARAERQAAVIKLRTQWERWGPVARHPLIPESEKPDLSDAQPRFKVQPEPMAYRTL